MRIGKPTSGRSPTREVLHAMRPTPTCIVCHKTTGDLLEVGNRFCDNECQGHDPFLVHDVCVQDWMVVYS